MDIFKSAALVTFMMLCFKAFGFVKQAVIAYCYGATLETDAYFIAWGFVSGMSEAIVKALLVSLVAIYTNIRIVKGKEDAKKLINGLIEVLFPVFTLVALTIYIVAPLISKLLAPSYNGSELGNLIVYIRFLSPILLFGCLEMVFSSVLDSHRRFLIPRLQSFIYSLSVIGCCLFLSKQFGISALILAQYISSVCYSFMLVVVIGQYHKFFFVKINEIPALKSIVVTAIPLFIGNSAIQINQIVDKSITSNLGNGAVSALSYCHTLEQFVTNIMIVNIGNVMFANFAEFVAKNEISKIENVLAKAIDILVCLLFYISIITIICAKDIVSIVYYRGSFTYEALSLTAVALIGYAISFVFVAIRDLTIKSLYAFKDTKNPMIISFISIFINIILSVILSKHIGIIGISLATSISSFVGMILNANALMKYLKTYKYSRHLVTLMKCMPAGVVIIFMCAAFDNIVSLNVYMRFLVYGAVGLIVYIFVLYICDVKEIKVVLNRVFDKLKISQNRRKL